jgi:hypothetical protein
MATGVFIPRNTSQKSTFAEEWNGRIWSIVASPDTGSTDDDVLAGVSCTTTSFCVAAGSSYRNYLYAALLEIWT